MSNAGIAGIVVASVIGWPASSSAGAPVVSGKTTSYYESTASTRQLAIQGAVAGNDDFQGVVILDFGRPGYDGTSEGTIGYGGSYLPFSSIESAVESYITAYYASAPPYTSLKVAVGTNNSCGTGQPCGDFKCGCGYEPPSYTYWGEQLASTVEQLDQWVRSMKAERGYTDNVEVIAADDAEPAFDPGYQNTYDVLNGYAQAVGGPEPPMVDFGSAEGSFWTEDQLYQVAYGFPPDVPMPEIYYPVQASEWGGLVRYAKARYGQTLTIFGVLTTGLGIDNPTQALRDILGAISGVSGQSYVPWQSRIAT